MQGIRVTKREFGLVKAITNNWPERAPHGALMGLSDAVGLNRTTVGDIRKARSYSDYIRLRRSVLGTINMAPPGPSKITVTVERHVRKV